jgi:hypothetical protein
MTEEKHKERFLNECTLTLSSDCKLLVHGSVMIYYCDDNINVSKALSNDDSSELVLDLNIVKGTTPIEASPRPFTYTEQGDHVNDYKQVTIRYQNEACTINVK